MCPTLLGVIKVEFIDFFSIDAYLCDTKHSRIYFYGKIQIFDSCIQISVHGWLIPLFWSLHESAHQGWSCKAKFLVWFREVSDITHLVASLWQYWKVVIPLRGHDLWRGAVIRVKETLGPGPSFSFTAWHPWYESPPLPHSPTLGPEVTELDDHDHKSLKPSSKISFSSL